MTGLHDLVRCRSTLGSIHVHVHMRQHLHYHSHRLLLPTRDTQDEFNQAQLLTAALTITTHILRQGGSFVAKIFLARETDLLYAQLKTVFNHVVVYKPKSSRAASCEAFVVCKDYNPPAAFDPHDLTRLFVNQADNDEERALQGGQQESRRFDDRLAAVRPEMQGPVGFIHCGDVLRA